MPDPGADPAKLSEALDLLEQMYDRAEATPPVDKVNVTWTGACSHCRTLITFTGYRSTDAIAVAVSKLGTVAGQQIPCPVCGEGSASVRCVGVALDPFAAVREDEDDDEDD